MAKSHPKYHRLYISGYDLSGAVRNVGQIGVDRDAPVDAALTDSVKNCIIGKASLKLGPVNAFLQQGASPVIDEHDLLSSGNGAYNLMYVMGTLDGPAVGDPIFAARMEQGSYQSESGDGFSAVSIAFPNPSASGPLLYSKPFGQLVHPKAARTAANTAIGTIDNGAATANGGIFVYHLFSSDGTVTLSIDDSATNLNNAAFAALSGATSGSIDASSTPKSGMVELSVTAAVRRYLRWQLALGTATTATFALGFIRG